MKPPQEDMTQIKCHQKPTVSVGEEFYFQFHRHGSVGEDVEFEIEDTTVVFHQRTDSEYLHPEKMKPGWTGGDAERCKWIFKALRPGKTKIKVRTLFRFEVESECQIEITVVF
ncbi:MAG: hypothetical protein ACFE7R_06850 [Candidatus Hodarchaeota archaeon]